MRSGSQGSARSKAGPVGLSVDGSVPPGSLAQLHTKNVLSSDYLFGRMVEFSTRQALRVYTDNPPAGRAAGYLSQRFNSRHRIPPAPTAPWALYLADSKDHYHWLGFDLDDHDGAYAAEVATDLHLLTGWLEAHDVPHLVCASGGGTGRHVWVRLSTKVWHTHVAEMAGILAARMHTLDHGMLCNPRTGVLRGPGSPHKDGVARSEPLPAPTAGRTAADSLDWLFEGTHGPRLVGELKRWALTLPIVRRVSTKTAAPRGAVTARTARVPGPAPAATAAQTAIVQSAEKRCPLPPVIRRLAAQQLPAGADASRPALAILIAMAHTGWTSDEVHAAALTYPGLTHLVTEKISASLRAPRSDAALHVDRQWANARIKAATSPPRYTWGDGAPTTDLAPLVTGIAVAAQSDPFFHGVRGASRTAVLYALLDQIATAHRITVSLSTRRWALARGGSRGDTHRIILELMAAGWITRTADSDGPNAAVYTVGAAAVSAAHDHGTQTPQGRAAGGHSSGRISDLLTHLRADVWSAPELGAAGGLLHHEMTLGPSRTAGELAARTHLDRQTVTDLLAVMETVGLAEHGHGHWRANGGDGLMAYAADELGAAGILEVRRTRYAAESVVWKWWCAEQQVRHHRGLKPLLIHQYGRFPTTASGRCDWTVAMDLVLSGAQQLQLDLAS